MITPQSGGKLELVADVLGTGVCIYMLIILSAFMIWPGVGICPCLRASLFVLVSQLPVHSCHDGRECPPLLGLSMPSYRPPWL